MRYLRIFLFFILCVSAAYAGNDITWPCFHGQRRNNISTDVLILGHYHLEMVMKRNDTLIIFSGCFVSDRIGYRDEFLSHIGAPIFAVKNNVSKLCMQRFKPIKEDYYFS